MWVGILGSWEVTYGIHACYCFRFIGERHTVILWVHLHLDRIPRLLQIFLWWRSSRDGYWARNYSLTPWSRQINQVDLLNSTFGNWEQPGNQERNVRVTKRTSNFSIHIGSEAASSSYLRPLVFSHLDFRHMLTRWHKKNKPSTKRFDPLHPKYGSKISTCTVALSFTFSRGQSGHEERQISFTWEFSPWSFQEEATFGYPDASLLLWSQNSSTKYFLATVLFRRGTVVKGCWFSPVGPDLAEQSVNLKSRTAIVWSRLWGFGVPALSSSSQASFSLSLYQTHSPFW